MKRVRVSVLALTAVLALWSSVWIARDFGWESQRYFSTQSVWLSLACCVLLIFSWGSVKVRSTLVSLTTLNMIVAGVVYHTILDVESVGLRGHLAHTFVPLLMVLIYFLFLPEGLPLKRFYLLLVYPIVYLITFIFVGPLIAWYPYDFMDVSMHGLAGVLRYILSFLTPAIILLALTLLYLKQRVRPLIP
jgi:hypothetical protein